MATKQPSVTPEDAREAAKRDAPRVGNENPKFGPLMPAEGGSYVREEDGSLRRVTKPSEVPHTAPLTPSQKEAEARARAVAEASAPKSK